MKLNSLLLILILLLLLAVFFLGRQMGSNQITLNVVQNTEMVKQIAELASLEVNGYTTLKLTNKTGDGGSWDKFIDYLFENTLQVNMPFTAKYGVQLANQPIHINEKDTLIIIELPACKLLAMQLRLDQLETMNQTGLFSSTTLDDLVKAEKQLYKQVQNNLLARQDFIRQSQEHIQLIFSRYYKPLGYHVQCRFRR